MNKIKKCNAITLISLIITIIVLLILAGVSINFIVNDNSIIKKSAKASEQSSQLQALEELKLKLAELLTQGEKTNYNLQDFINILNKDTENQYIFSTNTIPPSEDILDASSFDEIYILYKSYWFKVTSDFNIYLASDTINTGALVSSTIKDLINITNVKLDPFDISISQNNLWETIPNQSSSSTHCFSSSAYPGYEAYNAFDELYGR